MDSESLRIAIFAAVQVLELIDEFDGDFLSYPAINSRLKQLKASESEAQNWLLFLAWWDCATAKRIIGNGLTKEQADVFARAYLCDICERVGRDSSPDDFDSAVQFGMQLFDLVNTGLTKVWNDHVETGKGHAFTTMRALQTIGITLAETDNFKEIFLQTVRQLHERTLHLAALLRKETGWSEENS